MDRFDWRRICALHKLIGSHVPLATHPIRYVVRWHHFPNTEAHSSEYKDTAARHNVVRFDSSHHGNDVQFATINRYDVNRYAARLHHSCNLRVGFALPRRRNYHVKNAHRKLMRWGLASIVQHWFRIDTESSVYADLRSLSRRILSVHHSGVHSLGRTEPGCIDATHRISCCIHNRAIYHCVDCGAAATLRCRIEFPSAICAGAAILQHIHESIFNVPIGHSHMDSIRCVDCHRLYNLFWLRHPTFHRKKTDHEHHRCGAIEERIGRFQRHHNEQRSRSTQCQYGLCHNQHSCA